MLRKEMVGDVYTIIGIESSTQLGEFYNEVVHDNYEKYVGITTEGRRFSYDPIRCAGAVLPDGQLYAINPKYHAPVTEQTIHIEPETLDIEPVSVEVGADVQDIPVEEVTTHEEIDKCVELQAKIDELTKHCEVSDERARIAEQDCEKLRALKGELELKILGLSERKEETYTIEQLIDKLGELGWTVYLTRK